jgi:hypothetical protein
MGKKFTVVIGLLVLSMIFTQFLVVASSEPAELLQEHEGAVEEIVNLIEGGEKQAAIERLNSLHSAVVESRASLKGLTFEGKSGKKLTDPFKLPEGTYRVNFTTQGFGQVKVMPLTEDSWDMLFNLSPGQASDGASAVYRAEGRKVMVQFSNISEPYKLIFEKLG